MNSDVVSYCSLSIFISYHTLEHTLVLRGHRRNFQDPHGVGVKSVLWGGSAIPPAPADLCRWEIVDDITGNGVVVIGNEDRGKEAQREGRA